MRATVLTVVGKLVAVVEQPDHLPTLTALTLSFDSLRDSTLHYMGCVRCA